MIILPKGYSKTSVPSFEAERSGSSIPYFFLLAILEFLWKEKPIQAFLFPKLQFLIPKVNRLSLRKELLRLWRDCHDKNINIRNIVHGLTLDQLQGDQG